MKRNNNEVAQDGVESAASPLRAEGCLMKWTKHRGHATSESRELYTQYIQCRLVLKLWCQIPQTGKSTSKSEQTEAINLLAMEGTYICEDEKAPKGQEGRKINQNLFDQL